jgi:2'-5' RNA ligase
VRRWRPTRTGAPDRRPSAGSVGLGARPAGDRSPDGVDARPAGGPPDRRLFIAVAVPRPVRAALAAVIEAARGGAGPSRGVRWVADDGLHLTVRFLGATPPARVDAAAGALREAAASVRPFAIALAGAGAFPREDAPRALWLGLGAGAEELGALARGVDAALVRAGWPAEPRPFRAHLTLARCDDPVDGRAALAALRRALGEAGPDAQRRWRSDELVLFESHLGRGPARYEAVAVGRLGA